MRKYTIDLLKGFLKICQNQDNKTGLKRIGIGIAIIIEGGIVHRLKEGKAYFTDSSVNSEINAAFREMIENGWIVEEKDITENDEYDYFHDYKDYFGKTGLTYYSNVDNMRNELNDFVWPFGDHWFSLTSKGEDHALHGIEEKYKILDEKFKSEGEVKYKNHNKCFVIMPIGKEGSIEHANNMIVFEKIIKPCVENSGYNITCYHADLILASGAISKQAIEALRDDDIVIADLRRNNLNVSYELGIRHAFKKRSILVYSKQSEHLFYTTIYRAIRYNIDGSSNQDFYKKLAGQIDDIIQNPQKSDNPVTDILSSSSPIKNEFKIVDLNYPKDKGVIADYKARGYQIRWFFESKINRMIDIEGWEYAYVQEEDGSKAILKLKDKPEDQILLARESFDLSESAKELIKAATGDNRGIIMMIRMRGGINISTNGKVFGMTGTPEGDAAWEAALIQLVTYSLVVPTGSNGGYRVTNLGYETSKKV